MNYHVKFKTYEQSFGNVRSYKQLKKEICKGFQFLLNKDFNLYYFDSEGDKITMSCQDDFQNSEEPTNELELFLETNEGKLEDSDDSIELLSQIVAEHVESYRKLSSSINKIQRENEHLVQQDYKNLNETGNELQKNQTNNSEQKNKSILLINQKIQDLEIQIKNLEIREQENKIKQKLESVVFPVNENIDLGAQILKLPEIKEIDMMEKEFIHLNKVEKSQLQKKYYDLSLSFKQLISGINKSHHTYSEAYKEAIKQKTKYESNYFKIQKKTDQKIEELKSVIAKLREKLENFNTVVVSYEQEQQSFRQVEQLLDSITKSEIQERKQKTNKKAKKQIPNWEDLQNKDSDYDIE